MDIEIKSLTDQRIMDYSLDRVIMTHLDINLKKSVTVDNSDTFTLHPEPKGVYDPRYFGSIFPNSCNCGRTRKVGVVCDLCGSQIMTDEMAYSRFARIDCGIYYSSPLKFKALIKYLKSKYNLIPKYDENYPMLGGLIISDESKIVKLDLSEALLLCAITFDDKENALVITNKITDPLKSGLDSLVVALKVAGDSSWEKYLNRYILVTPARVRPIAIMTMGGKKKIKLTESTITYSALTYITNDLTHLLNDFYGKKSNQDDLLTLVLKKAVVVKCIQISESTLTSLSASSKENAARHSYSFRQSNSGRSVITGDPELKIDEIGIPYHLAYEALKSDFIQYLRSELNIDKMEAVNRYISHDQQVKLLFKEYAETRSVLMNRAPTLHKYNVMCHKIKLIDDSTIHLSPLVCKSYNADFDGDTMSYFIVPSDIQEYVESLMSPKYIKSYEKNDSIMFSMDHEIYNGLVLLSKVVDDNSKYTSITSLETAEDLINDGDLEVYSLIKYKGRDTTYGREMISNIIQAHLDHIIGPGAKITKSNLPEIYAVINKYDPDTRTTMLRDLQKLALKWVTEYGVSTPSLSELVSVEDSKFRPMVDKILNDSTLDQKSKFTKIQLMYNDREKAAAKVNADLVERINDSGRGKVSALVEMTTPLFMVNEQGDIIIPEKPLIGGLSEREYITHSFNNRALLSIKSLATPAGGWLTRQLVFLCQSYVINTESDPDNYGIVLPRYRCNGRTTVDGKLLGESLTHSTEPTRVRSIVQSRKGIVSLDYFPDKYGFKMDSRVGISLASSLTEQLTQEMLGLKHGGSRTQIPKDYMIFAPGRCKVVEQTDFNYTVMLDSGKKIYPSSPYLRFTKNDNEYYESGELMAQIVLPLAPTLTLEQLVKLIGAKSMTQTNSLTKVDVLITDSYTINGGIVTYDWNNNTMKVGDDEVRDIRPDIAYYYADGDSVPPRTKITSGLMTVDRLLKSGSTRADVETAYYIYRDQFYRILGSESKINEELIELVFRACLAPDGSYRKVDKSIEESASVLARISYGYASSSIISVLEESRTLTNDPMTSMLLNYMMKEAAHEKLNVK